MVSAGLSGGAGARGCGSGMGWVSSGEGGVTVGTVWEGRNEYFPLLNMVLASRFITGRQSWCKYRIMASECQRPSSMIVSVSVFPQSRAIAPPARRDRALISHGEMPVVCCSAVAANRSCLVTAAALME